MSLSQSTNPASGDVDSAPRAQVPPEDGDVSIPTGSPVKPQASDMKVPSIPQLPTLLRTPGEIAVDDQLRREIAAFEIFERSRGSRDKAIARFREERPADVFLKEVAEIGIPGKTAVDMLQSIRDEALRLYTEGLDQVDTLMVRMPHSFLQKYREIPEMAQARRLPEQTTGPPINDGPITTRRVDRASSPEMQIPGAFPQVSEEASATSKAQLVDNVQLFYKMIGNLFRVIRTHDGELSIPGAYPASEAFIPRQTARNIASILNEAFCLDSFDAPAESAPVETQTLVPKVVYPDLPLSPKSRFDAYMDSTPPDSPIRNDQTVKEKLVTPAENLNFEIKGIMRPPWSPQGFSVEAPYLPSFEEYTLVLEESLHYIRDSVDNSFDNIYEGFAILSRWLREDQTQQKGSRFMLEKRLHKLQETLDDKLSGIKKEIGNLSEGLQRGRIMSPAVYNLLWETLAYFGFTDRASFATYPIATYKHAVATHVESDAKSKNEMTETLLKVKPLEEQCQRLNRKIEQLEETKILLNAKNERLHTQNRSLGEEVNRPVAVAFRKRRVRSEAEISNLHEFLPNGNLVAIESSEKIAAKKPYLDHVPFEEPSEEEDLLADDSLADRCKDLKHSITQLVKMHYAAKPVRPIPAADGTLIIDFQIMFFQSLLKVPRNRRRWKICGLVFKYLNDILFTQKSTRSGGRDSLIRDVASGLLEVLRSLRYHGNKTRLGQITQSTSEELRSCMIKLCSKAVDLAAIMRNSRIQYQFETWETGTIVDAKVLARANILLAKGGRMRSVEVIGANRIAECIFGCLTRLSPTETGQWGVVAKGKIVVE